MQTLVGLCECPQVSCRSVLLLLLKAGIAKQMPTDLQILALQAAETCSIVHPR